MAPFLARSTSFRNNIREFFRTNKIQSSNRPAQQANAVLTDPVPNAQQDTAVAATSVGQAQHDGAADIEYVEDVQNNNGSMNVAGTSNPVQASPESRNADSITLTLAKSHSSLSKRGSDVPSVSSTCFLTYLREKARLVRRSIAAKLDLNDGSSSNKRSTAGTNPNSSRASTGSSPTRRESPLTATESVAGETQSFTTANAETSNKKNGAVSYHFESLPTTGQMPSSITKPNLRQIIPHYLPKEGYFQEDRDPGEGSSKWFMEFRRQVLSDIFEEEELMPLINGTLGVDTQEFVYDCYGELTHVPSNIQEYHPNYIPNRYSNIPPTDPVPSSRFPGDSLTGVTTAEVIRMISYIDSFIKESDEIDAGEDGFLLDLPASYVAFCQVRAMLQALKIQLKLEEKEV